MSVTISTWSYTSVFPAFSMLQRGGFSSTIEFLHLSWASHFSLSFYWPRQLVCLLNYTSTLLWMKPPGEALKIDAWSHPKGLAGLGLSVTFLETWLHSQDCDASAESSEWCSFSGKAMGCGCFSLFPETSLGQLMELLYGHLINVSPMSQWKASVPYSCHLHGPRSHLCPPWSPQAWSDRAA